MADEKEIPLNKALSKVGAFLKREAIRMCPVDQGELRLSIDYKIEGNSVTLFASAQSADDMEFGVPPHKVDDQEAADLTDWAHRHNAEPFWVIRSIEKHGIKVGTPEKPLHITSLGRNSYRPFLRPAVYMNIPLIGQLVAEGIKEELKQ